MTSTMSERKSLEARDSKFFLDGKPIVLLSGAIHYFRVVPEYWRDRLLRLKACGLNCVETYVPWNWHEEVKGEFNFTGMLDVRKFVQLADELGLYVIFRPGPYICSEWEFGGLPSWLLCDPEMKIRTSYKPYLDAVDRYFKELMPQVADLQYSKDGPIIAIQLENEYGSYANDPVYKQFLIDNFKQNGLCELFFTSDNGTGLQTGQFPAALMTANYQEQEHGFLMFEYMKNVKQPGMPLMVMEFWSGWFDHWGEKHHVWPVREFHKVLKWTLDQGSSVNFYMYHGGTNWGFMNGANEDLGATNEQAEEPYAPDVSSYDYDAPVAENGDLTEKWWIIRTEVQKRFPEKGPLPDPPEPIESTAYETLTIDSYMGLDDILECTSKPIKSKDLLTMEQLDINNGCGQAYGFILYRKKIKKGKYITLRGKVKDRAVVMLNQEEVGVAEWINKSHTFSLPEGGEENRLDILVENMGRVNYAFVDSPVMNDQRKGLRDDVYLNTTEPQKDWEIFPLEFKQAHIESMSKSSQWKPYAQEVKGPAMFKATLKVTGTPKDTYISDQGWTKGSVFVNGFNLGRYWERGPQHTLYLPGPLLREGDNEIMIFELHKPSDTVVFRSKPDLGEIIEHSTIIPVSSQLQIFLLRNILKLGSWTWHIIRLFM